MIISHSKKFIFIKTNKTASTSLQVFLSQFLDKNIDIISKDLEQENKKIFEISGIKDKNWDLSKSKFNFFNLFPKEKKKIFNHDATIKEIINFYGKEKLKDYYKITIVRNPFDQIISSFNWHNYFRKEYKNKDPLSIDKLIGKYSKNFFEKEKKKILYNNKIFFNQILKYENLESDLELFLKKKKLNKKVDLKDLKFKSEIPKKIKSLSQEQKKIVYKHAEFFFKNFYSQVD